MATDTSERGLERLICTALAGSAKCIKRNGTRWAPLDLLGKSGRVL